MELIRSGSCWGLLRAKEPAGLAVLLDLGLGAAKQRYNCINICIYFLWGTDPKGARFAPQSRSFSFTAQQGLVTLVLVSHRSKAGPAEIKG